MLVKDEETWDKIVAGKEGYIYNDFGTQFPGNATSWNTKNNNKLHKAACRHIKPMTYESDGKVNKHFFNSRIEAIQWLEANREQAYTLCNDCKP